ncbi:MAG: PDZ domain-containing protein [Planctomycetota bacterium]
MKRKRSTATLLAAAMSLPAFAQDPAAPVQAEPEVIVVQDHNDGEAHHIQVEVVQGDEAEGGVTRTRVIMLDAEGNIIKLDGDDAMQWVDGQDGIRIEVEGVAGPGVEFIPGDDEDIRVFLRQLGQPDVVPQAPVNPPMVEATYLGLNCEPLDFDAAALLQVQEGTGLNVTFVAPDSPAAAAGLEVGDTLLKMGDQILINPEQMAMLIRTHDAGEAVTFTVVRDGEEFTLDAELGTSTVPQLGPGGRNLEQLWNVERQGNAGQPDQFRILPEGLEGNLALINPQMEDIEQHMALIQQLLVAQGQAMPEVQDLREHIERMREQMLQHEDEINNLLIELHGEADGAQEVQELHLELAGDGVAAMQAVWKDTEHTITISGDRADNQTLNVQDAEGNELYDGPLPEGDALDELPEGVGDKVREMTEGQHFEFNMEDEEPAAGFDPAAWAGKSLASFEAQYGPRGEDVGSGVHLYAYTIDGVAYYVQSVDNETIMGVMPQD